MGYRAVGAGRHDGLEGDRVGAQGVHAPLEVTSHVALGAAYQWAGPQVAESLRGDGTRQTDGSQLELVLDHTQRLDGPPGGKQVPARCALAERGVVVHAEDVRLHGAALGA
jgi:hypothetical protein